MTRADVVVLDYGSGNVRSAVRALERAGAEVTLTADHDQASNCDGLVVPGVGAFAACMAGYEAGTTDRGAEALACFEALIADHPGTWAAEAAKAVAHAAQGARDGKILLITDAHPDA